jgi:hypothetical protein
MVVVIIFLIFFMAVVAVLIGYAIAENIKINDEEENKE